LEVYLYLVRFLPCESFNTARRRPACGAVTNSGVDEMIRRGDQLRARWEHGRLESRRPWWEWADVRVVNRSTPPTLVPFTHTPVHGSPAQKPAWHSNRKKAVLLAATHLSAHRSKPHRDVQTYTLRPIGQFANTPDY